MTVKHDKPLHVLVSPHGMHRCKMEHGAALFESVTMSKVIIYRSFCPRLAVDIIDSLDCSNVYRKMMHAANASIRYKNVHGGAYELQNINGVIATIYTDNKMEDIINPQRIEYIAPLYKD